MFKIIFILILIVILITLIVNVHEDFLNYKRCRKATGITKEVLSQHNVKKSDTDWQLLLPCSYTKAQTELKGFDDKGKYIYAIEDCDKLVSKTSLWKILKSYYGRKEASKIMPETYLLKNKNDKNLFKSIFNPKETYIMKNGKQRKQGIKLTNNINEILTTKDYFLVQKMIESHKQNGYKYNFRCYLLIICKDANTQFFLHNKIKYLYTKNKATTNKLIKEEHITDSYSMNKDIYKDNPRYVRDEQIYKKIHDLLKKVVSALPNQICQKIKNNTRFQMFGVDIVLDEHLNPYILEMNKGPDMKPKDDEDHKIKKKVIEDTFGKVDLIDVEDNEYREI